MPLSYVELHRSLLFHGGGTGPTPVRDANLPFKRSVRVLTPTATARIFSLLPLLIFPVTVRLALRE